VSSRLSLRAFSGVPLPHNSDQDFSREIEEAAAFVEAENPCQFEVFASESDPSDPLEIEEAASFVDAVNPSQPLLVATPEVTPQVTPQVRFHEDIEGAASLVDGVAVAPVSRVQTLPQSRNVTAEHLNYLFNKPGSKLLSVLRKTVAAKMKVSVITDNIDDHINTCITKLVSRDALKSRLEAGSPILDHHIAQWAVHSAYADIRNDGTNPVAREMSGARTERERTKRIPISELNDPRIVWAKGKGQNSGTAQIADIEDRGGSLSASATEDTIQFAQMWSQVEQVVRSKVPGHADLYMTALRHRADGMTVSEIAEAENLTVSRAATLVREARHLARKSLGTAEMEAKREVAPAIKPPSKLSAALARVEALRREAAEF